MYKLLIFLAMISTVMCVCSYKDSQGHFYDLTTLKKPTTGGTNANNYNSYHYQTSNHIKDFYVNICAPSAAPCNTPNAVCQRDDTSGAPVYYYCGNADDQLFGPYNDPAFGTQPPSNGGLSITYSDGQFCSNSNPIRRKSIINLACDTSLKLGQAVIDKAEEYQTCLYAINMRAREACHQEILPDKPPPRVPTFSSEVFLAASYITDEDDEQHVSSLAGVGNFYWDETKHSFLLNATQLVPSSSAGKPLGSLALYENLIEISRINDKCYYQTINHRMLNASHQLTYAGKGTYKYLKFNAGKEVQVDRYVKKGYLGDDYGYLSEIRPMLLIDSQTKEYVWADMSIFFNLFRKNRNYYKGGAQPGQWMEFNSATWSTSTIASQIFTVPNAWQCAKK